MNNQITQYKSQTTSDHGVIRTWTEERKGVPATVKSTKNNRETGILRIMFPETGTDKNLVEISWDEFFSKFDKSKLKFLYQEKTRDGEMSRFFKFVRGEK